MTLGNTDEHVMAFIANQEPTFSNANIIISFNYYYFDIILTLSLGMSRMDKIRNEYIRGLAQVDMICTCAEER